MPFSFRPSAEQLREQLNATRLLERMERFEHVAAESERATCSALQTAFAENYRRVIGVDPSRRADLHDALLRVADGGGMPVQDVLDALSREIR